MKFSQTDIVKAYKHNDKDALIKYIELMYDWRSKAVKIENHQDRKVSCMASASLTAIPEDQEFKKLVSYYLSYYQHHNRYTLLVSREELLIEMIEVLREPLAQTKDEDQILKNIKLKGEVDLICGRLVGEIESGYKEIYGDVAEQAKDQVRQILSPEMRLKTKSNKI